MPLIMILLISIMPDAGAGDLTGYLAGEVRVFANDPLHEGQKRDNMSIVLKPEYYQEWENGSSLTAVPFARIDSADRERSHFDIRELSFHLVKGKWELKVGIGKVFWGATHSRLKPMRDFAWLIRRHEENILSYFKVPIHNGSVEGLNNKAKVISHKAYGFRSAKNYILNLYHCMADLLQPKLVHTFM